MVQRSPLTSSTRAARGHQRGRWWGSATTAQTSSVGASSVRRRRVIGTGLSLLVVGDQRVDVDALEPVAAVQERELDQERAADDLGAHLASERDQGARGP